MKKSISSRIVSCMLVIFMLASLLTLSVSANNSGAALLSAPADGDKAVIYYPDSSLALGKELSGKKLAAVDAVVSDGKLTVTSDMGIFSFIKDETTSAFYLVDSNGKYFTSGKTGNSVSLEDTASEFALWVLEEAENGYYVKNYSAAYVSGETSKPQYLEYYSGFTTYNFNASKANIYTFAFYKVTDDITPIPPVEDESSEEESSEAEIVYSTISEARLGENNAVFNVKGVVTFVDGKNVVVADETGAINLYLTSTAEVSVGNKIAATGKRGTFSGLQQLTSASVLEVLEESAQLPALKTVTIEEIILDQETETLECFFVKIENVTLGETDAAKSTTVITDDNGNSINIYRCPELEIPAGTKVDVVALVSDYKGYQLRVSDASAITVADATEESSEEIVEDSSEEAEDTAKPGDSSSLALFAIIALVSMTLIVSLVRKENA